MIKLKNIDKSYGNKKVLNKLNLEVKKGEFISIYGPSGSGKSTILNILGLIDKPTSGEFNLNNNQIMGMKENKLAEMRNDVIGFVFQAYHLIPNLTVKQNLKIPFIYSKEYKSNKEIEQSINKVLKKLGIEDLANNKVEDLSGGEKQRVVIARVLVKKKELIIADEPTGNLDENNTENIIEILKSLNDEYGYTIILVTHNNNLKSHFEKNYQLRDGRLYLEK